MPSGPYEARAGRGYNPGATFAWTALSVWLLLGGDRGVQSGRPDLGFLGPSRFCREDPDFGYWISLDFLGFSRPNRDLSMGYEDTSEKVFSCRSCRRERAVKTFSPRFGVRKGRIVHGASLTLFLISCKILPALIALAVAARRASSVFRGFSSWRGLTRSSTTTRNHAIKAMIMLLKSEMARKWR
jgi:hypothetical protein